MSKNFFTGLIIFFGIIIIASLGWFLFFYQGGQRGVDIGLTIVDYLPFGKLDTGTNQGQTKPNEGGNNSGGTTETLEPLRQLAPGPISSFTIIKTSTSTETIRYIERQTGNIYDVGTNGEKPKRVSNTTVPRVSEAFFLDGGNTVIIRYLAEDNATIETYLATVPKPPKIGEAEGELKGAFLKQNIKDITVSRDGKNFFYITDSENGSVGVISSANNTNSQIFSSPLKEWIPFYVNGNTITLTTKPSGGINGYSYQLNTVSRAVNKIMGEIAGLTTLMSSDGKFILFSNHGETNITTNIYSVAEKTTLPLSISTITDKCAWNSSGTKIYCGVPEEIPRLRMPDAWYQGVVSFSDKIWSVNPSDTVTEILADPNTEVKQQLDITKMEISTSEKSLFFINKKDLSLWILELKK